MKTQKNLTIQTVGNNMRCWAHSTSWTFRLEGQGGARGMSLWFLPLALWHLSLGFYVEIQLFGPQVLDRESLHKSAILARLIQHIKTHCWLICFFTYFSEISPAFPGGIHKEKSLIQNETWSPLMEKTQGRISTLDENGYMVACILHFKTMAQLPLPTEQALRKCQKWVAPD